jgi:WD40 repeat protein
LILWDIETRRLLKPKMLEGMILGAFSQGTDRLVTVGRKTPVVVWDARSIDSPDGLKEITRIETNGNHACIGISPDGNWVAACEGRSVILWRCCKREAKPDALNGHLGEVVSIEFSPDSSSLVTTSRDQTARIWTVANPSSSKPLIGHTASVAYASFDLNGKQVASASADGTIRVWDVGTAEEVATLPWHDEGVNEVSFSRDGRILSASDDGSVRLGACKTCNSSLDELRSRIKHYAPLTENDRDWVKSETDVQMGWIRAPRFLSWGR